MKSAEAAEILPENMTVAARRWELCAFALFTVLAAATVHLHEPWADEANAWLLARDASLSELWLHLMHYEGSPAVWHTLLHVLIRIGFPYAGLNYLTGAMGCLAAWLFMMKAPFPRAIRLAVPFTVYLFYQYSVVARSYCLLPPLLFLTAIAYRRKAERLGVLIALLCVMAGVSVHGMILSGAIWVTAQWELWHSGTVARKRLWTTGGIYGAAVLLLACSAWPASDVGFANSVDTTLADRIDTMRETIANAFSGEWISSIILLGLSIPFLWRGRALAMFALSAVGLLLFSCVVYSNSWHQGILFLAWIFAMWIAGEQTKPRWPALAAFAMILPIQLYWAARTVEFDWMNPYSGAQEAAQYLRENGITGKRIFGFGFPCVGIQPYFKSNIFPNFRDGQPQSYFDWSEGFHNFEGGAERLAETRPEYAIVGYADDDDRTETREKATGAGYHLVKHFEGNLYWHTGILELNSFDLYRRE